MKLTDILNIMAPVRTFQMRTKYAAWVSEETKKSIKVRDSLQQLSSENGSWDDWADYKLKRNEVTSFLRKDKLTWQKNNLDSCDENHDTGKLWKNVLGWLNWCSTSSPTKLLHEGKLETSPSKLADIQNEYYIKKVNNIRQNLPQTLS